MRDFRVILRIASNLKCLLRKIRIKISNDIEKEEISQITEIKKYSNIKNNVNLMIRMLRIIISLHDKCSME